MRHARRLLRRPIFWVLAAALIAALFVYRDFGLTWDEPLFYDYGEAVGYAYSPANWIRADFDLSNSYGPSAEDHKTRGPGYLVLARFPAAALRAVGLDRASAWHLVNFLSFLFGVYCTYRLSEWFAGEAAAALGAVVFLSQPLLFGHGFINPKDVPFLVFFSAAVWFGTRAADRLSELRNLGAGGAARELLAPALFLGLASSNRVLGPLSGVLVALYLFLRRPTLSSVIWIAAYGLLGTAVMIGTWPFLWENPGRFLTVFGIMSNNPTTLPVLFADAVYRANELPLRYLPFYLGATLTEPIWPFFAAGTLSVLLTARRASDRLLRAGLLLAWLAIPVAYVLATRPPMYDGMRHFLFVLPPVFVLVAAGLQWTTQQLRSRWTRGLLGVVVLIPGLFGIVSLHPYEYSYYNAFVGGTGGAFRHYETEYWLTCYKEAIEDLERSATSPVRLFVHREASVAAPYADPQIEVLDERGARDQVQTGDFVLVSTRTNEDLRSFREGVERIAVGRMGATFCIIKQVQ